MGSSSVESCQRNVDGAKRVLESCQNSYKNCSGAQAKKYWREQVDIAKRHLAEAKEALAYAKKHK